MRAVQQPIEDGIGKRDLADVLMPVLDGQLTGDQRGAALVAILDHLHEVVALRAVQRLDAPVVDDQQVGLQKLPHQSCIAAVAVGDAQVFEQRRQTQIPHR